MVHAQGFAGGATENTGAGKCLFHAGWAWKKPGLNSVREGFTSITALAVDERETHQPGDRTDKHL